MTDDQAALVRGRVQIRQAQDTHILFEVESCGIPRCSCGAHWVVRGDSVPPPEAPRVIDNYTHLIGQAIRNAEAILRCGRDRLHDSVQALGDMVQTLEAERDRLKAENASLRARYNDAYTGGKEFSVLAAERQVEVDRLRRALEDSKDNVLRARGALASLVQDIDLALAERKEDKG